MTNPPSAMQLAQLPETVMGRLYGHFTAHESSTGIRILLIIVLAVLVHVLVKVIRHISEWFIHQSQAQKNPLGFMTQQPKFVTLTRLIVSGITFVIYFFAIGLILQELGVNLTAYLASASVVGLAISFGSQGLVQDVVIGLTLIFSDAMEVGDLVEIAGTTIVIGRVEEIGLRFTRLINFYNQEIFIPNRTIANVSRFPFGGVYAYADVQIPADADREKAAQTVVSVAKGMWGQFGAIILSEPVTGQVEMAEGGGWDYLRVHFKIWPGQGSLIETTFRQQMVSAMKTFDPKYADWQVPVTYRAMTAAKNVKPHLESSSGEPPG
ncbi:MAG: mechanosensitive ion channel domain-containing protein [Verrucomicrobiia bacterium]|jgi:small conductance mechanosensitive channel